MRKLLLFLISIGQLVFTPTALAHRPDKGIDLGITNIPDSQTSFAYYRALTDENPIHLYQVDLEAGQFFHAGINIPQLDRLQDYGVDMLLLGPGLPALAEETPLPVSSSAASTSDLLGETLTITMDVLPQSSGGVLAPSVVSEPFFEPFTQTNYWGRQTLELNAPETGAYYLLVWNRDGLPGKYVLDTGTEEVFGLGDIFRFPGWWLETRLYFEQGPILIMYGSLAILAVFFLYFFRRARRRVGARIQQNSFGDSQ